MCLTCGKHNADKLWYLDPEKHRIKSLGIARDIAARHLHPLIVTGLKIIRSKQPDYAIKKLNVVSRNLLNWFTRTLHGMQVLPTLEAAFEVINLANELALMPCLCHKVMEPEEEPRWRCLAMNIAADIYFRDTSDEEVRPISKDAAKDLVTDWRSRGAWQSVGWLWDANVIWLCNCDEYCSSYRAPEVEWAGVPSAVVTMVGDATACSGCGECATWCKQAGALHFGPGGRISHVDESFCRGCGLCVDHCPNGVLSYKPREEYYDVITKSVRSLGNDAIRF